MANELQTVESPADALRRIPGFYRPTPLLDLPRCAAHLGVAQVLLKDETGRALGSFKSLGGTYAALRAIARHERTDLGNVLSTRTAGRPVLLCASDGNHGLAVAAAARHAGTSARIFLHTGVKPARARRIEAQGGAVEWVPGTYDDAVAAARAAARQAGSLLVADTSSDPDDPVIADVMAGYEILAEEIRDETTRRSWQRPTHAFVQSGVGGLAAAMAEGLSAWMALPGAVLVVEPVQAACVAPALTAGQAFRIKGDLHTAAEMLSCGEASVPAIEVLKRYPVEGVSVSEEDLLGAPASLARLGGPATTPSGAAGFAGAIAAARATYRTRYRIGKNSRLLLLVTEGLEEVSDD